MTAQNHTASAGGIAPGIAVFAFGKRGYYAAAEHLALTVATNSPSMKVTLFAADPAMVDHTLFAAVHPLDPKWYEDGPGTMKVNIYDILPDGDWLVMDADMLVKSDLSEYIGQLKAHDFAMEVHGKGTKEADLKYSPWATIATQREVAWLHDDTVHYGVQSSWMWIRKPSKVSSQVFAKARSYKYERRHLKEKWGNDIPDELRFATALAELKLDLPDISLSFYGATYPSKGFNSIEQPVICLYGDLRRHRLVRPGWMDIYDRWLRATYAKAGRTLTYPLHSVMRDKYVNS